MTKLLAFGACVAMLAAGSTPAYADAVWMNSQRAWKAQDNCAHEAMKRFPDYTPESNAKRDRVRQLCMINGREALGSVAPVTPRVPSTIMNDQYPR